MKLALVQQHATHDRKGNLVRGLAAVDRAATAGAQVVCFAELAFEPFYPQQLAGVDREALAESIPGPITDALSDKARQHGMVILPNLYERDSEGCYDTTAVIDADGTLLGKMRMLHIPDYVGFHEKSYYTPGNLGMPVFDTAFARIGIAICYDRHYPEVMRGLALAGAQLIVVPQAGAVGEWPEGLFEAELRVASFQNGVFTALCNRVGREESITFAGESFACDPAGAVVARAVRGTDELLVCDLDISQIDDSCAQRLFLPDRRPDLYEDLVAPGEEAERAIGEINVLCTDLDRSLHFYRDLLGLELVEEGEDGVYLGLGSTLLLLLPVATLETDRLPYGEQAVVSFDIYVPNLADEVARLGEAGVQFAEDCHTEDGYCLIRDPDGLVIELLETSA